MRHHRASAVALLRRGALAEAETGFAAAAAAIYFLDYAFIDFMLLGRGS